MDPMARWISSHPHAQWYTQGPRLNWENAHGAVTDRAWAQALGRAEHQRRVVRTLEQFHDAPSVRFALSGVLATPRTVVIPVALRGANPLGHVWSQVVYVHAEPDWTMAQVHAQIEAFVTNAVQTYGVDIQSTQFLPGVQLEPQQVGPQNATNLPGPLNTIQ